MALIENVYFWSAILVIGGGAFTLGVTIGNSKFDNDKNILYQDNMSLKKETMILKEQMKSLKSHPRK